MDNAKRLELIRKIDEHSFCMDDIRLFLDTHPCNMAAIADFNKHKEHRDKLVREYVENFGPLNSYSRNVDSNDWLWVAYPWPWEGAC